MRDQIRHHGPTLGGIEDILGWMILERWADDPVASLYWIRGSLKMCWLGTCCTLCHTSLIPRLHSPTCEKSWAWEWAHLSRNSHTWQKMNIIFTKYVRLLRCTYEPHPLEIQCFKCSIGIKICNIVCSFSTQDCHTRELLNLCVHTCIQYTGARASSFTFSTFPIYLIVTLYSPNTWFKGQGLHH